MIRAAIAIVVIEVACGVVVQATGVAGPIAIGVASGVVLATALCLLVWLRRPSLAARVTAFLDERDAAAPATSDPDARTEYERDTLYCYRRLFDQAMRRYTRRLLKRNVIGPGEAHRLNSPRDRGDIATIAERLAWYEELAER